MCVFLISTLHVPASIAADGARMEASLNVTHTSGKRGVVVSGVRSGSAMLGDDVAGWELRTGRGH